MIRILHITRAAAEANFDLYAQATMPMSRGDDDVTQRDEAVITLYKAGAYKEVATVEGDDLELAYMNTNSGGPLPSWSMMPRRGVTPTGTGYTFVEIPQARADQMRREAREYASMMTDADRELDHLRYGLTTRVVRDGLDYERQPFGYKSTSVGDLMICDGKVYVVAGFGFDQIDVEIAA